MALSRFTLPLLLALILLPAGLRAQMATSVVISEFATRGLNSNQGGEFVELYNPTDRDVAIGGWKLAYRSATGGSYSPMVEIPAGTTLPSHGYYLLAGATWAETPTPDARWTSTGMADNGTIRLTDATDREIDRVAFGSGNDPKGSPAPNHGDKATNNSVERKASGTSTAASLGVGGPEEFAGNGWNSGNNSQDFVEQSTGRNPQNLASAAEPKTGDGSGAAYAKLASVKAGATFALPIVFRPQAGVPLVGLRIVVPSDFTWSRTSTDVELDPDLQATVRVLGDTIECEQPQFGLDTAIITIRNLVAGSLTAQYPFTVLTKSVSAYRALKDGPMLLVLGGPIPISDARENDGQGVPKKLNEIVTVTGIVTASKQFGSPSYIQDATGGMAIYDFNFSGAVNIGDEVTVTGKVTQFNGLTELANVTIDQLAPNVGAIDPVETTIEDLLADGQNGIEKYESTLILLRNISVNTATWTVTGSGTNYKISNGSKELDIRVDNDVDFANLAAPGGTFDVVGVVSQYQRTSPFVGGYQLMPRMKEDIIAKGPRFESVPTLRTVEPTSVEYAWRSYAPGTSHVRYGLTPALELGVANGSQNTQDHVTPITGLQPATVYHAQAFTVAGGDTSFSQHMLFITKSATSSGSITAYFNKSVDNTIAPARGLTNLKNVLLDRIDAAQFSIDVCLYSLSGNVGDEIVNALISAKNRGVKVRFIMEADNSNTTSSRTLRSAVPSILDTYDAVNAGAGLMHNKFYIIDARDRSSDTDDYVITGSWNATDQGSEDDAQNVVVIQDQALAVVYTREFEEMWGGSGDNPTAAQSRFGIRKTMNTPTIVQIGDVRTDVRFSPTDQANTLLLHAVQNAKKSVYFAVLTFTRDDLSSMMLKRLADGIVIRGVVDNNSDQGAKYSALLSGGVDILLKSGIGGLLHHKYMIVDADDTAPTRDPLLITGSHNWSNAAEYANNENTLGFHNRDIALHYLAEWYKRYRDAGGKATIVLSTERVSDRPSSPLLVESWPNPARGQATVRFSLPQGDTPARLILSDVLGRTLATLVDGESRMGTYESRLNLSGLPSGRYFLILRSGTGQTVQSLDVLGQ